MRIIHTSILACITLAFTLTFAQDDPVVVSAAQHEEHGAYLTDANGHSLYLFLNDQQGGESNCYETCAQSWPPLLTDGEAVAGAGVDPTLLGSIERSDGSMQVTYNGWPLYHFTRDRAAGEALGHRLGNIWHLVSPAGRGIGLEGEEATVTDQEMALGAEVYRANCAFCHGAEGAGAEAPRLANNSGLADLDLVLGQIMRGGDYMPAFRNILDDEQIAAVATFIGNSWENAHGPVSVEEVSSRR